MRQLNLAFFLLLISSSLMAQDVDITGTISKTVKLPLSQNSNSKNTRFTLPSKTKVIKLLKMKLSTRATQLLSDKAHRALAHRNEFSSPSLISTQRPAEVQLGMNTVPVLDQGSQDTCATFAVTAAIDAVLNKGDYVSQLCQLQIGNYFATNGYAPSGWNGSLGRLVLSQMDETGIVSKEQQVAQGCGGLIEYPSNGEPPESSMSLEEYHQISERMNVNWWTLLDIHHAISQHLDTNVTLNEVKDSLIEGDRIAFGILLFNFDEGFIGAAGKKGNTYDSWILTPEMIRNIWLRPSFYGGHAMIITGYDDNAIAVDNQGREYKGLLTLRNSWGDQVGDHGNFYMSYDYFKLLVLEAQRISSDITDDNDNDQDDTNS